MAELRIARDLVLPLDIVTQAIAILARKGAGKTYTAKKLVELVIGAKIPVGVIDPTGGWWGLRTSADGDRPGLPVVIFGGDHADVPLERGAGKEIADVVLEHAGAYILDLSLFESRAAEQTFVADFLERLYRGKKRETGPLLLVVDEADMFAPQRPGPEQTRSLGALEAIVRRGRIKGLGDLLITQRAAVLNKNVLTQTEVLVVMQTTGPQDRAAIDAWIEGNGTREERATVLESLASLERGEAWVWSPSFLRVLQRVRILPGTTFDSSRTPEAGEVTVAPRAFAPVDVEKLGARITAAIEKAKADDPRELRKRIQDNATKAARRIAELEAQVRAQPIPEPVVERIEVPVLNGQVEDLRAVVDDMLVVGDRLAAASSTLNDVGNQLLVAIDRVQRPHERGQAERAPRGVPVAGREPRITGSDRGDSAVATLARSAPSRTPAPMSSDQGDVKLKAGARRMLSALAMLHPTALTRGQVATLSDISPTSGTFSDYLSAIRSAALIVEDGRTIALSSLGEALFRDELGGGAPSSAELLDMWGRKLKAGARRMLSARRGPSAVPLVSEADRMAASRARGAQRHVEVIAQRRPTPPPPPEEPAMVDAAPPTNDVDEDPTSEPIALEGALERLASRATAAAGAWSDKVAADQGWVAANEALEEAWSLVRRGHGLVAMGDLIEAADRAIGAGVDEAIDQHLVEAVVEEARASVGLAGETQVVEPTKPSTNIPDPARPVDPPPAELIRLTTHQRKVLETTIELRGDRTAVAKRLGIMREGVDGTLERIGKAGLLPTTLIPLLPARFAQYATVRG